MSDLLRLASELIDGLQQPGADPRHPSMLRHEVATRRMMDARRGHPGSPSTAPGRATSPSSPVERAVDQPDIGGRALAEWQHALRQLAAAARSLDRMAQAWTPRPPTARALRETEAANVHLCEHCGDDPLRAEAPTDVGGNLAVPIRLCRWCYDYALRTGRLADSRTLQRRRNGQRIMVVAK